MGMSTQRILLGSDKKDIQKAAKEYFKWTLPAKITKRMCVKHPNIIKETEVLIHGLCHKWSSTQTFLALTLFRETSKYWLQEVLKDEIVGQMAAPLAEAEDVLAINEEYIFFMMMT